MTWKVPPIGSVERATLDRWCVAVGPVAVEAHAPTASRSSSEITVVTWNTHVGSGDIAAFLSALRHGEVTGTPAAEFVLLLQETVRHGAEVPMPLPREAAMAGRIGFEREAIDILAAARSAGLNVAYVPSMRNGPGAEDRGNAVLTTLPLAALDLIELPFGRQRRVAIAATLDLPGSKAAFRVVTAHLDTALRFGTGGPAKWRRRQADALLGALAGSTLPTIVGADLNTWWGTDEPAVDDLRRAFPAAVDRVSGPTWRGPMGAGARLDHMFVSGWDSRLEVRRAPHRFGSDHFALYVIVGR